MVDAIQLEWIFLQRITWGTGDAFAGVEKIIRETFLPRLFFRKTKTLSIIVGYLSTMPFNKSGLVLLKPVTSAHWKYLSSLQGSAELVRSMTGGGALFNTDHLRTLSEERRDENKDQDAA